MMRGEHKEPVKLKASFSVEAAWVFGIILLVIYTAIGVSFTLYHKACVFVEKTTPDKWDAVGAFRLLQMGENILEGLKD